MGGAVDLGFEVGSGSEEGQVEAMILEEQIADWVMERAKVSEESLTFDQLVNEGVAESQ